MRIPWIDVLIIFTIDEASSFFENPLLRMLHDTKFGFYSLRLDSTSMMLQGDYDSSKGYPEDGMRVTFGYSKDNRPDLKQRC